MSDRILRPSLILFSFVAFVALGLPDGLLGIAWPSIRSSFDKPLGALGLPLGCSTSGYLISSFLGGRLARAFGVGGLLAGSSFLVTAALTGTAAAPSWPWLLLFALMGGLGAGAIDAGINAFAAVRFSARIVNWLHAFWGVGATLGPLIMTATLAQGGAWRTGYLLLGGLLAALSAVFFFNRKLWEEDFVPENKRRAAIGMMEALGCPVVWIQMTLFFIYGGIESTAGQLFYSLFTESWGMRVEAAGVAVAAYWGALTGGRLVFGHLTSRMGKIGVIRLGTILAPFAALIIYRNPRPDIGAAGAVLLGFGLAPLFPTFIADTSARVGAGCASYAVGFQIAAASLGIAVFPGAVGNLMQHSGPQALGAYLLCGTLLVLGINEWMVHSSRTGPNASL